MEETNRDQTSDGSLLKRVITNRCELKSINVITAESSVKCYSSMKQGKIINGVLPLVFTLQKVTFCEEISFVNLFNITRI